MNFTKSQQTDPSEVKLDIISPKDAVISKSVVNQTKLKPTVGTQLRCTVTADFTRSVLSPLILQLLVTNTAIIVTFIDKTGARE